MTGIGHTLTGIAIGVTCLPEKKSRRWQVVHLTLFGILANVPDFRLSNWGHFRYYVSHSIFINLFIILNILSVFIFLKEFREKLGGWSVVVAGILAWLSHLLLDTFYNHGIGLMMFWPFSEARLALPIPWFSVVTHIPPPLTLDTVRILGIEFICYGALLLAVVWLRKIGIIQKILPKGENPHAQDSIQRN
jgi:membrane-bound metal-dependent hydrolase YbcI (DUF457 family)